MALPEPVPGLIISYDYLWHRERTAGRDEGAKTRPCAVIAALRKPQRGSPRVLVLPITHQPPRDKHTAVEIPVSSKARLGLDDALSWIMLNEWNDFAWPGPDLRRIPGRETFVYGMLSPRLFRTLQSRFLAMARGGTANRVPRSN